jgi:hypothetical protein
MQFDGSLEYSFPARVWNVWAGARFSSGSCYKIESRLLFRTEWMNEYFYLFCIRNLESVEHLFVECPILANSSWRSVTGPHCLDFIRRTGMPGGE